MPKGKKYGGRAKGTPNKKNAELRGLLGEALKERLPRLLQELDSLGGKEYADAYATYCKFVVPSLQSVSLAATVEHQVTIEDRLKELCDGAD